MTSSNAYLSGLFSLQGKVAMVVGGTGTMGSAMAMGLACAGAKVGILGQRGQLTGEKLAAIESAGGQAMAITADVVEPTQLERACHVLMKHWGRIDILINTPGNNVKQTSIPRELFFKLERDLMQRDIDLNLMGTILPCRVFGEVMANQHGCIVNVVSPPVPRAMTRVAAYTTAKTALEKFTRWLAVDMTHNFGDKMRVNAVAPGFFIADENYHLMMNGDRLTVHGEAVINQTLARRFGDPCEMVGAVIWLCSPCANFVNGTVIAVDGGFGAYSSV